MLGRSKVPASAPRFVLIFQASDAAVEYCQFVGTNVLLLRLEIVKLL